MPSKIPLPCTFYFISILVMLHKNPTSFFIKWWTMIIHRCSQPRYLWSLPIAWSSSIVIHQATWSSTQINTWFDLPWMTWPTSCHHVALLVHQSQLCLLLTIALVHRCQVFPQTSLSYVVHRSKASGLPFTLATSPSWPSHVSWSFPPSHTTSCHVSYAMNTFITTSWALQQIQATSPPWLKFLTLVYLWTNHLCMSTLTHISQPRLSRNYQNQTRVFQWVSMWALPNRSLSTSQRRAFGQSAKGLSSPYTINIHTTNSIGVILQDYNAHVYKPGVRKHQ
jgi:hypothetical protein